MKRFNFAAAVVVACVAFPAFAGGNNLSGPHYNLNILGVENPKTTPMTGSDRHTIFVALGKSGTTHSNIYLTPGPFAVCDGNSADPAYACDGTQVASQGAVFQLPCDLSTPTDTGCSAGVYSQSYQIWARALGTPGGNVTITTCGTDPVTTDVVCSTDFTVLSRTKGHQTFQNVTTSLTSVNACIVTVAGQPCVNMDISLFDPTLENYFWDYANNGVRLVQLRFYPQ